MLSVGNIYVPQSFMETMHEINLIMVSESDDTF